MTSIESLKHAEPVCPEMLEAGVNSLFGIRVERGKMFAGGFFFFNSKLKSLHFCFMVKKVEGQDVELTSEIVSFIEWKNLTEKMRCSLLATDILMCGPT